MAPVIVPVSVAVFIAMSTLAVFIVAVVVLAVLVLMLTLAVLVVLVGWRRLVGCGYGSAGIARVVHTYSFPRGLGAGLHNGDDEKE